MNDPKSTSRIQSNIDLERSGRQVGDLQLKWSDNRRPAGAYQVPIICLAQGQGPTVLLIGGVHGDEFEGPAALMRLAHNLAPEQLQGRVIILPALNTAAVMASSRVSPLDRLNLNRSFPGDPDGSPSLMLAHFLETELIPNCDAVIDLHSGGQALQFACCVLAQLDTESPLAASNLGLARAFGAPYVWVAGAQNDDRSVNAAAARQQLPMIAAELGGGGGCDPQMTDFAERAILRCLHHLGVTPTAVDAEPVMPSLVRVEQSFVAPARGLLDRKFGLGDEIEAGQTAGWLHFVDEPERASLALRFPCSGIVLAHGNRGLVERGDLVALLAKPHVLENR